MKPVRQLQKTVTRFEGQLLKRSRFLGWKPTWVGTFFALYFRCRFSFLCSKLIEACFQAVLERGVLTYFTTRADASSGVKRRDFKYLDGARASPSELALSAFNVDFSDGTIHKLSVPLSGSDPTGELCRQVNKCK